VFTQVRAGLVQAAVHAEVPDCASNSALSAGILRNIIGAYIDGGFPAPSPWNNETATEQKVYHCEDADSVEGLDEHANGCG
jgi:hypothetical protein